MRRTFRQAWFACSSFLVEQYPATTSRPGDTECIRWHEVIGSFDANAHESSVCLLWHANGLPEVHAVWIVLRSVVLLDAYGSHVACAVRRSRRRKRSETVRQNIHNVEVQVSKVMLQLCHPLDADEAGTHD
eukprot:CAMPEP_0181536156 /NCGR_PEP_ID=MMETSP1110-20121109/74671_1 /TAXON_ID=174948 /ORGANISM="Symbiodinium sp., Strain CCMP421" /LENGTH=130 /DNA_ID=CAMNT_0023667649 /DNA_START=317 /DNA_END=709 /DNA_ORIENTATION=-